MTIEQQANITWLAINQNEGLNAEDLVDIMALLINLERLSLNSDALWWEFKMPLLKHLNVFLNLFLKSTVFDFESNWKYYSFKF